MNIAATIAFIAFLVAAAFEWRAERRFNRAADTYERLIRDEYLRP